MRRLVLDMDVGIDDALAIMLLAAEPGAEIVALGSCQGNCRAEQAAFNALRVLETCGLYTVPVAIGSERPMGRELTPAWHIHGDDGLGNQGLARPQREPTEENAVDQLLRLSLEQPGELDLLAVGSMTNVGLGLRRDAKLLSRFRSVTILGGYARRPRRGDPHTEDANIFYDAPAAELLFAAGVPITVVPIDTTAQVVLSDDDIQRIKDGTTPQAQLAWKILPFYFDFYQARLNHWTSRVHDPVAAAVILHPALALETVRRPVVVERFSGGFRAVGQEVDPATVHDGDAMRIISQLDVRRFTARFVDAIVTPLGKLPPLT